VCFAILDSQHLLHHLNRFGIRDALLALVPDEPVNAVCFHHAKVSHAASVAGDSVTVYLVLRVWAMVASLAGRPVVGSGVASM